MATYTVFGATVPASTDLIDGPTEDYGLGTVVQITAAGSITHARWYFPDTAPTEPVVWHVCDLTTLEQLGAHEFVSSGPGWVEEELIAGGENTGHVEFTGARDVLVWVGTPNRYVFTPALFAATAITNGPLTAPATGDDPVAIGNGRLGGDRFSPPQGAAGGAGCFFPDFRFADPPAPPAEGAAALTVDLAVAAVGDAPTVAPATGVADVTVALAVAAVGDAPPITPSAGAAALGIEYTIAGVGDAPTLAANTGAAAAGLTLTVAAVGDAPSLAANTGTAALSLVLAAAATGDAPAADSAEGAAALGIVYGMVGAGLTPEVGSANGAAALGVTLTVAAVGDAPPITPAQGAAALTIALTPAAVGDGTLPPTPTCELWPYDTTCMPDEWPGTPAGMTLSQRASYDFAVELLSNATLGQFGVCELIARPCTLGCAVDYGYARLPGGWFGPYLYAGRVYNGCGCAKVAACGCDGGPTVRLDGPVAEIVSVKIDGEVLDPSAYHLSGNTLTRVDGEAWPLRQNLAAPDTADNTFAIRYRRGVPVPAGGRRALSVLMVELYKARCGDGTCRLPARVTNIVREGVTYQMLDDPSGLLDAGRTGIADVDMWLASVNPTRARTRMRVYSPDLRPQRTYQP